MKFQKLTFYWRKEIRFDKFAWENPLKKKINNWKESYELPAQIHNHVAKKNFTYDSNVIQNSSSFFKNIKENKRKFLLKKRVKKAIKL